MAPTILPNVFMAGSSKRTRYYHFWMGCLGPLFGLLDN
jgi:hypothetical protein